MGASSAQRIIREVDPKANREADDCTPREGGPKLFRCDGCEALLFGKQVAGHECETVTVADLAAARLSTVAYRLPRRDPSRSHTD